MTGRVLRSVLAGLLLFLSVLSITLAPVSVWGRDLILDTDGFVATVGPLASDAGVQNTVIVAVNRQVDQHLDVQHLVVQALPPRAAKLLGPALKQAVLGLVNKVVTTFVHSSQFRAIWNRLIRFVHQQLDNLLAGATAHGAILVQGNAIVLDLGVVVQQVKDRLVAAGIGIAAHVPTVGATIVIAHVQGIQQAQAAVRVLNALANWLPWLGLLLLAGAIAVAPWRRLALLLGTLGVCGGMALLAIGLLVGKDVFLSAIPSTSALTPATATTVYDTLVTALRTSIRIVFVVAFLVAAVIAWALGPYPGAPVFRALVVRGYRWLPLTPVATRVAPLAWPIRVGVLALAVLIVLLQDSLDVGLLVGLAVAVVILLSLLQLLVSIAAQAHPVGVAPPEPEVPPVPPQA